MKPTMQRIAELTGVSRGTVDRALHRRGRVDPEVEARVLRAAREIGYPLDRPARTVRSPEKPARRRIRIGVITYLCKAGFMQQINRGIARASEELAQWGVEVLLRVISCSSPNISLGNTLPSSDLNLGSLGVMTTRLAMSQCFTA